MAVFAKAFRWVAFVAVAFSIACGGVDGPTADLSDVHEVIDTVDVAIDVAVDLADSSDAGSDVLGEELVQPKCSPETVGTDCSAECAGAEACQYCRCNTELNGGTCEVVERPDEFACDDGDPCSQDDRCALGACVPGTSVCDCRKSVDCVPLEDRDLCNGTLVCNLQNFPFKCEVDPGTVVVCPTVANSACMTSQCDPATGACAMASANEGLSCPLTDKCTATAQCILGNCVRSTDKLCNPDDNPCTDAICDEIKGCVQVANTADCDDGNKCTENDHCALGVCKSGAELICGDGNFCNGIETCDRGIGCVAGTAVNCDDSISCTDDSCSNDLGRCVHAWRLDAVEGPRGAANCSDGNDNDCDGLKDAADPECQFGLDSVNPVSGPTTGGTVVQLFGASLGLVTKVFVDGVRVDEFSLQSASIIKIVMPAHLAGFVDFRVESDDLSVDLHAVFLYVTRSEDPDVVASLLGPTGDAEIVEGTPGPLYESLVSVPGVTDVVPVPAGALLGQIGYGPRNSAPWVNPSWVWSNATGVSTGFGTVKFSGSFSPQVGGLMDVAARFSIDGGASWVYADQDGTANGYAAAQALKLVVFGAPRPGAIVINELMWMGSYQDDYDEWIELRNMTAAPYRLIGWKITGAKYPSGDIVLGDSPQVVGNAVIPPNGYFLIAQFERSKSQVDAPPDIAIQPASMSQKVLSLKNSGPFVYQLKGADGTIVDEVHFTALVGFHDPAVNGLPSRSMERKAVPGSGMFDSNWRTAAVATGWKGDPFQVKNFGTPRGQNSDIPQCAKDDECAGAFAPGVLGLCQRPFCQLPAGRCGGTSKQDGDSCNDGDLCSEGDLCQSGTCVAGANVCGCRKDADCGPLEDNNLCNGTLVCNLLVFPYECVVDATTIVACPTDLDGDCMTNQCDPADGSCSQKPANEGGSCVLLDSCTSTAECFDGACTRKTSIQCAADENPCTDASCDESLGCVQVANTATCDDLNACTENDYCDASECKSGSQKVCIDNLFCNGIETCDSSSGCVAGTDQLCDDSNACTDDSCSNSLGKCVNTWRTDAVEGPRGSANCTDGLDNDCDNLFDAVDPECLFGLDSVTPADGPTTGGTIATLIGASLDLVTKVFVDGVEVAFDFQSSTAINVTMPAHAAGAVGYRVESTVLSASLDGAFMYVTRSEDPSVVAFLLGPLGDAEILAGQSGPTYEAEVTVAGLTDLDPVPVDAVLGQMGYGPRDSLPWFEPSWIWSDAAGSSTGLGSLKFSGAFDVPIPGVFDVVARFSIDGGASWVYADLDGTANGYDSVQALKLTVLGTARPGAVVVK
jgi:hypothetical protein